MKMNQPNYNILSVLRCLLLGTLAWISLGAHGNESSVPSTLPPISWETFNTHTVDHYVLPAYKNLNTQAQALNKSIQSLCHSPVNSTEKLQQSQQLFHDTMDAWQYIQNIQFGPIQTFMRNYSMQFWPDKKNHVSKHLSQLLHNKDQDSLSEDAFHKTSVSIKGLPAIERFLFVEDLNKSLSSKPFNCKVLIRISNYVAQTTRALVDEWLEFAPQFSNTNRVDGYFEDDIDAATSLLKTLIEPIEVIRDLKLLRPLGSEFGQQKSKRLESWRSQRSLRNIKMNIQSLSDFYHGKHVDQTQQPTLGSLINKQASEVIERQFKKVLKDIDSIPSPIDSSIDTKSGYEALLSLSESLKTLHGLLESAVNNQGIHLGFNSRDGD